MKAKLFLVTAFTITASLFALQKTNAQNTSPFWSLSGNNNATGTYKLGTTNNKNLNFYTNNLQRMTINAAKGDVGIGTTKPTDRLDVNSPFGENAFSAQISGSPKLLVHSGGGVSIGNGATPPANGLFVFGNTGIGTSSPTNKLHVFQGSAGFVAADANSPLVVENSTHSYISILAPDASETGILFGNPAHNVDGGIVFNNFNNSGGLQFRTNGNTIQMVLNKDGNLGVGTINPFPYKTKITHFDFGLDIQNAFTLDDWEIVTFPNLNLLFNGDFKGSFNSISGAYTAVSDERLKTNIKPMPAMLDKINQLKPSSFQFKNTTNKQEYNGFIAQDVLKIFPYMVTHNVNEKRKLDVYSLDYSGFGVIAIKGIQELEPIIEEQKKINDEQKLIIQTLDDRVTRLEALLSNISSQKSLQIVADVKDASLEQNEPNPFKQNTIVRYHLSQGIAGQINIYNETGNLVKTFAANETGEADLNGADLKAGIYSYTLIVNGKIIDTKKMVVIK